MCLNVNAMAAAQAASSVFGAFERTSQIRDAAGAYGRAAADDFDALSARATQQSRRTADEIGQRALQAEREIGRINAVLADSNLSGSSAMRLKREASFNASQDIATLRQSNRYATEQTGREMRAVRNTASSRINSLQRTSIFETGMKIGGAFIDPKGPTVGDLWDSTKGAFKSSKKET